MATSLMRGLSLISVGVVALTSLSLGSASAGTLHPFSATWLLNEAPGATVAVDSSGNGHNGTIEPGTQVTGAGYYRFNGYGRVVVPNDPKGGLDPSSGNAYLTVVLRTTSDGGMNVVQKGQAGSPNGYWKLEVNQGHVACTFSGPSGSNGVWLTHFIDDGQWHAITCARVGNTVSAALDYGTHNWQVNAVSRATGDVHNSKQLTIGGKVGCANLRDGCDGFVGDIDSVKMSTQP